MSENSNESTSTLTTALPPQKKRRTSSIGDQRIRSRYWFEDGNVVLQAENTLFRVHQFTLSRHSRIFKDTFAKLLVPFQKNECIEGSPVAQLSDTAEDLQNLISLLYDNDKTLKFGYKLFARVLGSMLRLGRKYDIAYLQEEALARLHHDYPTTLKDWDSLRDRNRQIDFSEHERVDTIISIAHEFRLFTILPAAYAQYLEYQYLVNFPHDGLMPEKARADCMIGITRVVAYLKDEIASALCPPLVVPSKTCRSHGKCHANRWTTIKNLTLWETEEDVRFGIFALASETEDMETACSQCQIEITALTHKVRLKFWSLLPTFFGLPVWANLKDGS